MAELPEGLKKQVAEAVTAAATATTNTLFTEKVENVARQAAHVESATTAAAIAKQYCTNEVANTARQAADVAAQQQFDAGLATIQARCNSMAASLQRAGVVEVSNRTAALEALKVTAQQMADTRYTQQNFFFTMAGWPGDCVKARGTTIKDAISG